MTILDELTGETRGKHGGETVQQTRVRTDAAKDIPFTTHLIDSATAPVAMATARISTVFSPNDPDYDQAASVDYYMQGLSERHRSSFTGVLGPKSNLDAQILRDTILEDERIVMDAQAAGAKGLAGLMLGAVIDPVQLPLMLMSGGSLTGAKVSAKLASTALGPRTSGALAVAAAGAEAGVYTGLIESTFRSSVNPEDVPEMVASGIMLGGLIGGATKYDYGINKSVYKIREDISDIASDLATENTQAAKSSPATIKRATVPQETFRDTQRVEEILSPGTKKVYRDSLQEYQDLGLQESYKFDTSTKGGKAAENMQTLINRSSWTRNDFDTLTEMGPQGAVNAYKHLESPWGLSRNNRSSAALMDYYFKDSLLPLVHNNTWRNYKAAWVSDKGFTGIETTVTRNTEIQRLFSREVALARAAMYHDGAYPKGLNEAILGVSEVTDTVYSRALGHAIGDEGTPVKGFETLETRAGWAPQTWSSNNVQNLIHAADSPGTMRKAITDTLVKEYKKLGITEDKAVIYAKSLVTRQLAKAEDLDLNVLRMLNTEGDRVLVSKLVDNGFTAKEAEGFVDSLKGLDPDKGKIASAKSRLDIDPRTPIEGTDLLILDLLENDVFSTPARYTRGVSGSSALARNGSSIDQLMADNKSMKEVAVASGVKWTDGHQTTLDNWVSYFGSGPINGGVHPVVQRLMRLTNMALLPQVGLTQFGETGALIGTVGMSNFVKAGREVLNRTDLQGKGMLAQLEHADILVDQNRFLFDPEYAIDEVRRSATARKTISGVVDQGLASGTRAVFTISGMFKVMEIQQRASVLGFMHLLHDNFSGGVTKASLDRLADTGLSGDTLTRIQKYFKNGTVKPVEIDGVKTLDLGLDSWTHADKTDFRLAIYRFVDQQVQRSRPGEESSLWNNTFGAAITHLRTFPLVAMAKTTGRNVKHGDAVSGAILGYGLATAGMAYSAKQIINGREENLTVEKISKGAIGYSNMTSMFPMFYDPAMSMLGHEELRLNNFRNDVSGDILALPPILPTTNRLLHLPESLLSVLGGEPSRSDVYTLQTTPLVGNAMGVGYLMHKAKDWAGTSTTERKAAERKAKRDAEKITK